MATINGTSAANRLVGTVHDDVINGYGGADLIYGQGGADTINGGVGNDTLHGGYGDDKLSGQGGLDRLYGEGGSDRLLGTYWMDGGSGADRLFGAGTMHGGTGNDHLFINTMTDRPAVGVLTKMYGDSGNDTFSVHLGLDDHQNSRVEIHDFTPGLDHLQLAFTNATTHEHVSPAQMFAFLDNNHDGFIRGDGSDGPHHLTVNASGGLEFEGGNAAVGETEVIALNVSQLTPQDFVF